MQEEFVGDFRVSKSVVLGKGAYGTVYLGYNIKENYECAVKISDTTLNTDAIKELEIHSQIISSNIVKLYHHKIEYNKVYLFLEKMDYSLGDHLQIRGFFSESESLYYFEKLLQGIGDLHSSNVLHRDIKLDNIFCKGDQVKLGDFNLSSDSTMRNSILGTPNYMSPEIFQVAQGEQKKYGTSIDLWSAGVVLYHMLFGKLPYHINRNDVRGKLLVNVFNTIKESTGDNLSFPTNIIVTKETKNLLAMMLDWRNAGKLNLGKIYNHEALRRFRTNQEIEEKRRASCILKASAFMAKSIFVDTREAFFTSSLGTRFLAERIDSIIANEETKAFCLSLAANTIVDMIEEIEANPTENLSGPTKPFLEALYLGALIQRGKLYFMKRNIVSCLQDRVKMNQLIKVHPHTLNGDIDESSWAQLKEGAKKHFEEQIKEHNSHKEKLMLELADIAKEFKRKYLQIPHDMKPVMLAIEKKDEVKFNELFENNSMKVIGACVWKIDQLKVKKTAELAKDAVCFFDYFCRYIKLQGIDWHRFKVKMLNLTPNKKFEIFDRVRKEKGSLGASFEFNTTTIVLILMIVLAIAGFFIL